MPVAMRRREPSLGAASNSQGGQQRDYRSPHQSPSRRSPVSPPGLAQVSWSTTSSVSSSSWSSGSSASSLGTSSSPGRGSPPRPPPPPPPSRIIGAMRSPHSSRKPPPPPPPPPRLPYRNVHDALQQPTLSKSAPQRVQRQPYPAAAKALPMLPPLNGANAAAGNARAWGDLSDDRDCKAKRGKGAVNATRLALGLGATVCLFALAYRRAALGTWGSKRGGSGHDHHRGRHAHPQRHYQHDHELHHRHHLYGRHQKGKTLEEDESDWDYKSLPFRVDDASDVAGRVSKTGEEAPSKQGEGGEGVVFSAWIFLDGDDDDDDDSSDDDGDGERRVWDRTKNRWKWAASTPPSKTNRHREEERIVFSTGDLDPARCETFYPSAYRPKPPVGDAASAEQDAAASEEPRAGMALYVNGHKTGSQLSERLMLAYRTSYAGQGGACRRLVSTGRNAEVQFDEWVHVAVTIETVPRGEKGAGEEAIRMYLDGSQVAYRREGKRLKPAASSSNEGQDGQEQRQRRQGGGFYDSRTVLGRTSEGTLELGGDLGMLGIWSSPPKKAKKALNAGKYGRAHPLYGSNNNANANEKKDGGGDDDDEEKEKLVPEELINDLWDSEFALDEVRDLFEERRAVVLALDADLDGEDFAEHSDEDELNRGENRTGHHEHLVAHGHIHHASSSWKSRVEQVVLTNFSLSGRGSFQEDL